MAPDPPALFLLDSIIHNGLHKRPAAKNRRSAHRISQPGEKPNKAQSGPSTAQTAVVGEAYLLDFKWVYRSLLAFSKSPGLRQPRVGQTKPYPPVRLIRPEECCTGPTMKKTLLTLLVCFSVLSLANAGTASYSGKEMKQVVQQTPPPCPTWTGFYLGVSGGYERALFDPSLSLSGTWIGFDGREETEHEGGRDFDVDGGQLGGVIGFNYEINHWVFGLEGSGAYLWARDSRVDHFVNATDVWRTSTSVETDYLATAGGRIGYAFCRFMPYVTGGAAFGNIHYRQSITFPGGRVFNEESGHKDEDNVGWFVGGGLEYALTDHWHIRGDYKYIDLGDTGFHSDFNPPGALAHSSTDLREHSATASLIYKF